MKLHHFCIIFVIIAIPLFAAADIKVDSCAAVFAEKEKLDHSFSRAIDDAAVHLAETDGINGLKVNKERAVNDFFFSLFASLGIMDSPDKQELIRNYVPVIAVTCEDGYYLYYSGEYRSQDNTVCLSKQWSEKHPYYYEDKDFIYGFTLTDVLTIYDKNNLLDPSGEQSVFTLDYHELKDSDRYADFRLIRPDSFLFNEEAFYLIRKGCIVTEIEKSMAYFCNVYNGIAWQYGITYNFSIPVADNSEWTRSIDNPSILVTFQGYPLESSTTGTYNRFAIAGARIRKKEVYYLEQKEWYYLYHKADCAELKKGGILFLEEPYDTVLECAEKGAYACPICSSTGVCVPDYEPIPH